MIADVAGIRLFYREAGEPVEADHRPATRFSLVVAPLPRPHPRLADWFHVIAADYPLVWGTRLDPNKRGPTYVNHKQRAP